MSFLVSMPYLYKVDLIGNLLGTSAIKGHLPFVLVEHNFKLWSESVCVPGHSSLLLFYVLLKNFIYLFIFREKGGREGERERNVNCLPLACPQQEAWPATRAGALTGNRTCDLLVPRPTLNPLSHTSQGFFILYYCLKLILVYITKLEIRLKTRKG